MDVSDVLQNPKKGTADMRQSLTALQQALECPLCHQMLREPSTLACAHTFCRTCIDAYCCNHWECPIKGCGLPVTVGAGRFRKINPSLQTVVTSWTKICQALSQAEDEWWCQGGDTAQALPHDEESEEEEILDLQAGKSED